MKNVIPFLAIVFIASSCSNNANKQAEAQQRTLDSMKVELAKQQAVDSINNAAAMNAAPATPINDGPTAVTAAPVSTRHYHGTHHSGSNSGGGGTTNYTTNNYNQSTAAAPAQQRKKGWSSTAKGAVIGAGVGAITGAMVDGRKGEGAVVGGLIGAGAGAGTGLIIDKSKKDKSNNR